MLRPPPALRCAPSGRVLWCLVLVGVLAACAGPPKKQAKAPRKRTILATAYDDARVGREASKQAAAQMGLVEDPELTAYVRGIGRKLLRGIPRSFDYQFSVVDMPEPNAFALPGGYIFVSRGLLALANNEDELACVLGHEITHAAQRHAAAQQGLAARGNPLAMPWNRAAKLAAYGRDMERAADKGGQILCAAAGYDPVGMSTFLRSLGQAERLAVGYQRAPSFFDTHPGSTERAAANAARAMELRWQRDPALGDSRAALLRHIDGLAVGQRPEAGVFQGDHFLHPDLDFHVRFPHGWRQSNSNQAVGAASPRGDAVVFLTADAPAGDRQRVAEEWLEKARETHRLSLVESKPVKVGAIDAWRMRLSVRGVGGSASSYVTFIPYRRDTWRITGVARSGRPEGQLNHALNTTRSFRPLTEEERRSLRATRLRVVTARKGETLEALGRRTGSVWSAGEAAVYNGVFATHRFAGGEQVKIARSEPYEAQPAP
ncbi:MAG: M48 family metalloprotease [Proteobacteria bacterium]|nr:M48 family metalloprotease [Pseudomonadota bacterium]